MNADQIAARITELKQEAAQESATATRLDARIAQRDYADGELLMELVEARNNAIYRAGRARSWTAYWQNRQRQLKETA
jgi:hypothetical protein